jgi:hypothetical protein
VRVLASDGSRWIASAEAEELTLDHQVRVVGLHPSLGYELAPRAEDRARNLGRGQPMGLEPRLAPDER